MVNSKAVQNERFTHKELSNLQILLASVIPVAAVLIVGAYGTQRMAADQLMFFIIVFLLCAIVTFVGEQKIISMIQHAMSRQCAELTMACGEFLAGNKERRVTILGDGELADLAQIINMLLEQHLQALQRSATPAVAAPATPPRQTAAVQSDEAAILNRQLLKLLNELAPIADGDLRVKTSVPAGYVGVVADTCNSLIEELAQFAKWTRYAAQQVMTSSQSILDRSIEMAKATESQMHRLSQTTGNIEEIVAFIQRLSNTLQLSAEVAGEIYHHLQEKTDTHEQILDAPLSHLTNEAQRQSELLDSVLDATEETSSLAESLIGDLYTVAQQIHQSSTGVLKTAERISELAMLAERWHNAAEAFTLADDENEAVTKAPWLL